MQRTSNLINTNAFSINRHGCEATSDDEVKEIDMTIKEMKHQRHKAGRNFKAGSYRGPRPQEPRAKKFNNAIERDLFAMRKVLKLLKEGTIRWIGELGRQY